MASTIEYEAVTAAHRRANNHAMTVAREAADAARAKAEAELDPNVYDPQKRADILDRADTAYQNAWEMTYSSAWDVAYAAYLPQEYERLWEESGPKTEQLKEPLTPRSERRF